jgi:peptide/nickel transport system ATP-binding protein
VEEAVVTSSTGGKAQREQLLDVRNLCVSFYDSENWYEVLKDVSFAVEPGEVVGIVGESGCGKSLTALSVLGLLPRHGARLTGEMLFEGRDLVKLSEREMRDVRGRRISMVFQEPMSALDPVFPIGNQIFETVRRHFNVGRREAHERVLESLAAVGIPSPSQAVNMYPSSLSGGMRQRVLIAMALVCEPRLLIADEPTTALDVTIQAQIMDLLLELGQRTGTAILFITHNLGLVAESCRRMLTMYAGQVVEDGQVRDILARPFHPYTAGLLGSIPQAVRRKSVLSSIPGRVPSPDEMPPGCRFAPRCTYAEPRCLAPQDLTESSHARHVRCCRFGELALTGAA